MKTTDLNGNQMEALKRVSKLSIFAAKVAGTVLSSGFYSAKQASIINEAIEGYVYSGWEDSDAVCCELTLPVITDIYQYNIDAQKRQYSSSMR
jgi:hypothetical protein